MAVRLFSILLAALLTAVALASATTGPPVSPARPNVVVIMTDDQTYADLATMPHTLRLLGEGGATFERSYVSYPLCCPSRATYLTGQYAHNHGVRSTTPPEGGVERLDDAHALPVWLRDAGYDTIHIGKYLNGYGMRRKPRVPPGWTDWHGAVDKSTYQMYGYTLYENGVSTTYGDFYDEEPGLYQTDVFAHKARSAIAGHAGAGAPFFLSLNFVAPHGEVDAPGSATTPHLRPAPRHEGSFWWMRDGGGPAGEDDVRDKPAYVRGLAPIGDAGQDRIRVDVQARRESLLAVDEAVESVVSELERIGELASTYILFTSDNGFFQGEHRIPKGKYLAYEPATHVPLLMRGPGIAPGTISDELVANTDLAPTILELTGARADLVPDGRSLMPFARDGTLRSARGVVHEGLIGGSIDRDGASPRRRAAGIYYALRTDRYLYIMWRGGARELYDLRLDPGELDSRHRDPAYAGVRRAMSEATRRLRRCAGPACLEPVSVPEPLPIRLR